VRWLTTRGMRMYGAEPEAALVNHHRAPAHTRCSPLPAGGAAAV
jgi:hypothetical protein